MTFEDNLKTIARYGYEELAEDLNDMVNKRENEDRDTIEGAVNLLAKTLVKSNGYKMMLNGVFGAIIDSRVKDD